MKHWYTLNTKPKAEYMVSAALRWDHIETYLPEVISLSGKGPKRKVPYFPGYLFARVNLDKIPLTKLIWLPGVRRIVAFDERPSIVPDQVIELIKQELGRLEGKGGVSKHPFQPGDKVKIVDGPFEGLLAIFDQPTTDAERVQVLLSVLGNLNRVQVPAADLKLASPDAENSLPKRPRRTRGRGRRIKGVEKQTV